MKKILILTSCLLSTVFFALAQEEHPEKNDKIESYKIAFITERLNLSPKDATVFWPVYNEFSDQLRKMKRAEKERVRAFKDKTQPTDAESEKFTADLISFKQQDLDLTRKYIVEFKKVLSPAKVAKLITLEQEFKMALLHKLKDKHGTNR
jgi:hypothetical protein